MTISDDMKSHFRIAGWLALVLVIFDTWLSIKFGWSISLEMAGVYGAISLASGTFLVIALWFYMQGFQKFSGVLGVAWVFAFVFNIWSNMGVATANRMADVQNASVQKAKYTSAQDNLKDTRTNLALWTKMLGDLQAQSPWVASVKADALRDDLKIIKDRMVKEEQGQRGKPKGKGKEHEKLENEASSLAAKIAAAEKKDDLTSKIEGAKAVLAAAQQKAATTDAGVSNAANQSALYAKVVNVMFGRSFSADPTEDQVAAANEGTGIATAFVLALLATATTLVSAMPALFGSRPIAGLDHGPETAPMAPMASNGPGFIPGGTKTNTTTTNYTIAGDDGLSKALKEVINSYAARMPQKAA